MPEPLDQEIRTLRTWFWSERDPDGRAFVPLAEAHWRRGDLEEAEALLREGLTRHPNYATGHLVAARVARARGDADTALVHLDRVLDLDPGNVLALLERADCRASAGDRAGARADLQASLSAEPGNREAVERLEALQSHEGDEMPSFGWSPESASPSQSTSSAETAREAGQPPASPPDGHVLPSGEPRIPDLADRPIFTRTMGDLYARQGFHERAVEVYERLVEENPDDEEVAARLGELSAVLAASKGGGPPEEPGPSGEPEPPEESVETVASDSAPPGAGEGARAMGNGTIEQYFEDLVAWVPGAIPIESLAPDAAVSVESLAPGRAVPIESLAPEADSTPAPGTQDGADEGLNEFQRWLESLRP